MTQIDPAKPIIVHLMNISEAEVVARLSSECILAGGQKAWADAHGVSNTYVHDVLKGRRGPGEAILAALGLTRIVSFSEGRS